MIIPYLASVGRLFARGRQGHAQAGNIMTPKRIMPDLPPFALNGGKFYAKYVKLDNLIGW